MSAGLCTAAASKMSAGHSMWVLLDRYTTGLTSFKIEAYDAFGNAVLTRSQLLSTTDQAPLGALSVKICPPATVVSTRRHLTSYPGEQMSSSPPGTSTAVYIAEDNVHEYSDSGLDFLGHEDSLDRAPRRRLLTVAAACGALSCPDGSAFISYAIVAGTGALTVRFDASAAGEYALSVCGLDDMAVPAASRGVALGGLRTPPLESGVSFAVAAVAASAAQSIVTIATSFEVGPGSYCLPRHRVVFDSKNEGLICV